MPAVSEGYSRRVQEKKENSINIYLSGFDKRYLQKFVARVSFEACLELDHSFFNDLCQYKNQTKMTFEISARGRSCFPWSVNFLGFFLAVSSKVFREASLSPMKEQVSRLAKSAVVQYVIVFRLTLAKRVKH